MSPSNFKSYSNVKSRVRTTFPYPVFTSHSPPDLNLGLLRSNLRTKTEKDRNTGTPCGESESPLMVLLLLLLYDPHFDVTFDIIIIYTSK